MDIPPDFHIEYAIINLHLWMIMNKLGEFKVKKFIKVLNVFRPKNQR